MYVLVILILIPLFFSSFDFVSLSYLLLSVYCIVLGKNNNNLVKVTHLSYGSHHKTVYKKQFLVCKYVYYK